MFERLMTMEEKQRVLFTHPTPYRTGPNTYMLPCGGCEEIYYVDEVLFYLASTAIEKGKDNPFRCGACNDEFERPAPQRSH
jgi:hypothetical protein